MSLAPPVDFTYLEASLQADAQLRDQIKDKVKDLEKDQRACLAILNRMHVLSKQDTTALLQTLQPLLPTLRTSISSLASLIPPNQFYRYNDHFTRAMQSASFIVVVSHFLETEDVASKKFVEETLGIDEAWSDHFLLQTEDYLHSLISLLNELSRLAVNRVTLRDYTSPVQFSRFAKELSTAFGLLNLKNDSLRKRFDGIKYDVKKLEEVVYDLSLRGLLAPAATTTTTTTEDDDEHQPAKRARAEETA